VTVGAGAVGTPSITTTGDTNTGIFFPAADTIAFAEGGAEAMRIDSSGNLGIGVTPSAWNTNSRVLQIGVNGYMGLENYLGNSANVWANLFRTSPSVYNYLTTAAATLYSQSAGQHTWYNAPSGTAGNSATLTQAMTLDNSGNLGIGTTTIAAGYGGGNGSVTLQNAKSLAFNNASNAWSTTTTGAAILYFTDNNLYIDAKDSTANIIFRVNGATERMRIDSSGNVLIGVTSANANGGVLQLKSGITFPATQVAATDANTLDDYEEGTWTPTIEFGGASVGLTYASQLGRYTKIGNQVTVWFDVRLSAKGSSTGNVTIPGLPFVINSNSRATGIGDPIDAMTGLVAGGAIILQAAATTSFIYLFQQTTTARGLMGSSNFNNTSAISGSITYFV
jgi:hypothetical protein